MPLARRAVLATCATLLALLPTGCQAVGAEALATGRAAYNAVITRSGDEQLLLLIVRDRYDESFGLLQVAGVTAQVNVRAEASADFAIGPLENYAENLVPFSMGAGYEESPTITYVPLAGEALMTRLVAPVSLTQALALGRLAQSPGSVFRLMVRRANGHANALEPGARPSAGFERVAELWARLFDAGVGDIVGVDDGFALLLHDPQGLHRADLGELLQLLGLTAFDAASPEILVPIRPGVTRPAAGDALVVETRSILEVLRIAGDALDVPGEHVEAGLVAPGSGRTDGAPLRIRSSSDEPGFASVAVKHHGWWFYVDATDGPSKRGFVHLRALVDMGLDQAGQGSPPVLTLPVGG
jgi:hypothetical protein